MYDFAGLNRTLLGTAESVLRKWFPAGEVKGREYVVGDIYGTAGHSLSINMDTGVWKDFSDGPGGRDFISLYAAANGLEQGEAFKVLSNDHMTGAPADFTKVKIDLKPKSQKEFIRPPAEAPAPTWKGKPAAVYEYRDADGLLYYIGRFERPNGKKEFLPMTWNGSGWSMSAPPVPRPLYGLQKLAKRTTQPVILTEGEKAADALQDALGDDYIVMTWPNGAEAVDKADWSALDDLEVVMWPDADEPGAKAAELVVSARGNSVTRVIDVSQLPDKYDAADAVADGWTADTLIKFISKAKTPIQPSIGYTFSEVASTALVMPPYVLKGIISVGELAFMFGESGCMKSFVASDMVFHMAMGYDWHGHRCRGQHGVLVVLGEGQAGYRKRMKALSIHYQTSAAPIYVWPEPVSLIDSPAILAKCISEAELAVGIKTDVVLLDTFSLMMGSGEESQNSDVSMALSNVRKHAGGRTIIFIHHTGHGDKSRERGAYQIRANADVRILVSRDRDNKGEVITISNEKQKDDVAFEQIHLTYKVIPVGVDDDGDQVNSLVMQASEALPDSVGNVDIVPMMASTVKPDVLKFINWVNESGNWIGIDRQGPASNNIWKKHWRDQAKYPKALTTGNQQQNLKIAHMAVEDLIKDGLLVLNKFIPGNKKLTGRDRDDYVNGLQLTEEGLKALPEDTEKALQSAAYRAAKG